MRSQDLASGVPTGDPLPSSCSRPRAGGAFGFGCQGCQRVSRRGVNGLQSVGDGEDASGRDPGAKSRTRTQKESRAGRRGPSSPRSAGTVAFNAVWNTGLSQTSFTTINANAASVSGAKNSPRARVLADRSARHGAGSKVATLES